MPPRSSTCLTDSKHSEPGGETRAGGLHPPPGSPAFGVQAIRESATVTPVSEIDWPALRRLRRAFLEGSTGEDYWRSTADLRNYDLTFAQRIGWKWDFVLEELSRLGWRPPRSTLVDWGCGSGIASRAFLDHFGSSTATRLHYADRSSLAVRYALSRAREKYDALEVAPGAPTVPGVLLLSHVITELSTDQVASVLELAKSAEVVCWVEPGSYEPSMALIAIRERLRETFNCVAPCPHQDRCGILSPGNEPHWCHHFARSPAYAYTDSTWGRFAAEMEIDLRSLPVSFLVLDRRPVPAPPADSARILGRPRIEKGRARLLACARGGVRDYWMQKRIEPSTYQAFRKGRWKSLQRWRTRDGQIVKSFDEHDD